MTEPSRRTAAANPLTLGSLRVCPECAGPIVRASGCLSCAHCGWGRCG